MPSATRDPDLWPDPATVYARGREFNGGDLDRVTLEYTIDDDGIWLHCQACASRCCLGYSPPVGEVTGRALAHVATRHSEAGS